jgi:uncharacterized protein
MDVFRVEDPAAFLAAASPLLLADEARHNLILGIAGTLRDHPSHYLDHGLWLAKDGSAVVGAALITPPHNLVVARPRDDAALEALAAAIGEELPGVVAAQPEAELFAAGWAARTGARARTNRAQGVFALERVDPRPPVSAGCERPELPTDPCSSTGGTPLRRKRSASRLTMILRRRLSTIGWTPQSRVSLWEDDRPVSLAAFGNPTPNGIRIRARVHAARAPAERLCLFFGCRALGAPARRAELLLPLYRPREPDREPDLRADRLSPGMRSGGNRLRL